MTSAPQSIGRNSVVSCFSSSLRRRQCSYQYGSYGGGDCGRSDGGLRHLSVMASELCPRLTRPMPSASGGEVSAPARAPRPRATSAAATSSRPGLFVPRLTMRTDPWSSFLTIAAARDAASNGRDDSAPASGPSFAAARVARISSLASDHRAMRGTTGVPFTTSRSFGSRKRSQKITSAPPHVSRMARTSAAGGVAPAIPPGVCT